MTEEEVQRTIKTPSVLIAFDRAKMKNLPGEVRKRYEEEDAEYNRCSLYIAEKRAEGEAIGEARGKVIGEAIGEAKAILDGVKKRLLRGHPLEEIAEDTGLSLEEIQMHAKSIPSFNKSAT